MAGERAGKSEQGGKYAAVKHLLALSQQPEMGNYLVWILGREYINCKAEFDAMAEAYIKIGLLDPRAVLIRDGGRDFCSFNLKFYDDKVAKTGPSLTVETVSVGEPTKIQRVAPDGILACEVGLWTEIAFLRTLGRLAQSDGWLWASGSFEHSGNWLVEFWRKWQGDNEEDARAYSIPSHTNLNIFPGGATDPKLLVLQRLYPPYLFKQRFMGEPAAPEGLVFSDFSVDKHVSTGVKYNPDSPVYLFIDPGFNTAYSVLVVQVSDNTVYVIDELYEQHKTSQDIVDLAQKQFWWKRTRSGAPDNIPYCVIDVAGTQHHAERSAEEVWSAAGLKMFSRRVKVDDGIDRVRSLLRSDGSYNIPQIRIHPRVRGLISEMGGCPSPLPERQPWSYKQDKEGNIVSDIPDDKNNDACKALAYGLIEMFGFVDVPNYSGGPVSWTEPQGPQWTEWGDSDVKITLETQRLLRQPGATYLCFQKLPHTDFAGAKSCKGHD